MTSLCSSLSVSFNSSKHFHLYGSNASLAQVSVSPPRKAREQRSAERPEGPPGGAGSGQPREEVWAQHSESSPQPAPAAVAKASWKPRAVTATGGQAGREVTCARCVRQRWVRWQLSKGGPTPQAEHDRKTLRRESSKCRARAERVEGGQGQEPKAQTGEGKLQLQRRAGTLLGGLAG